MLSETNEIKVMILYLFLLIDEKMEKSIADGVISSCEMIHMFDYVDIFDSLVSDQLLYVERKGEKIYCGVTERGKEVAREADKLYLLKSERESAAKAALDYYEEATTGVKYVSALDQTDGGYILTYLVTVYGDTILEAKMRFEDEETARGALENCSARARVVSRNIMAVLTGDVGFMGL